MKTKIFFWCLLLFGFLLVACSSSKIPGPIATKPEFTNKQIIIYTLDYNNSYKTADLIYTEIRDLSGNTIVFPNNYNIRIFERTNLGWTEIYEKTTTRLPKGDFIISPLDENTCLASVAIFPDLPDINQKYTLRIYVTGQMLDGDEKTEVFAYTDVILMP